VPSESEEVHGSFRGRVLAGEPVYGAFVNLGSTATAEIMGLAGFDWLVIDLEHGVAGEREAFMQLQAIAHTGASGIIRVAALDRVHILHALDSGAAGVLVPQIESIDEARFAVACCRYAGTRGVARYNRSWSWGQRAESLTHVDARVLCCIQIERAAALDRVEEIAGIDGVDVLFVGPADLGHSLGIPGPPDNPDLLARVEAVAKAAARHGKVAGILTGAPEQAARYRELGFTFIGCSSDSGILMQNARAIADTVRALG
jgi:4-hydroxy-2-oxoheptanedioate aldolase